MKENELIDQIMDQITDDMNLDHAFNYIIEFTKQATTLC